MVRLNPDRREPIRGCDVRRIEKPEPDQAAPTVSQRPTFDDLWESPGRIQSAQPAVGIGVLSDRNGRASQLAGDEHSVYASGWHGTFQIDAPMPNVERLFVNERVSGNFAGMPRLRELFAQGARDFSGLTPEIEKLALGWGIASVPASEALRKLWADTLDDLDLARFPNLEWLQVGPKRRVAAELRTVELLERLELSLEVASLAKLSLIGSKDQLEYLWVDGGGLASVEGVKGFGALRTAKFVRTGARDFSPLANSLIEDLRIDHRKPIENGFRGLGEMPALRRLHLVVDAWVLEQVGDLHRAPMLESIDLQYTALGDAVIDSMAQIETLQHVVMYGATKAQGARLSAARPDLTIVGGTREEAPEPLEVEQFDGEWAIFGDIASLIDAPTNYAAERKVKAALDPSVRKQLSFDTEAGMFSAQSTDRGAVDTVGETIWRLAENKR